MISAPSKSQKAPRTRRCIKTCQATNDSSVVVRARKHLAPEGALRLTRSTRRSRRVRVRKHLAPEGALRLGVDGHVVLLAWCQKAPRTRRCIKAVAYGVFTSRQGARKHPAPEGALRHRNEKNPRPSVNSQKAPRTRRCIKTVGRPGSRPHWRPQKAPRTRRCIKTRNRRDSTPLALARKHPAPEGALRR